MANTRDVTLYAGDATPKDIILRELPVPDAVTNELCMYAGDATPKDIILRAVPCVHETPAVADEAETRLWLFEDAWESPDEYEAAVGFIDNLIEEAAAVADDSETRLVPWEEALDLVVDEEYIQNEYTEPIGGPETYVALLPFEDAESEHPEGVIPEFVEDAAVVDDPEARVAVTDDGSEEEYPDVGGTAETWEATVEEIGALWDDWWGDENLYDPSFVSEQIDEPQIEDSLEGITAVWDDWEVEVEWGEWSTDYDAEAEPARRPRRPSIRPIKEGQGTTAGVEGRGEIGAPKAHGTVRKSVGAKARATGVEGKSDVGTPLGRGKAKATPAEVPESHGELARPTGHGEGHAAPRGVEGVSEYGAAVAHGGGKATGRSHAAMGFAGTPKARGIRNPTDAEMLVLLAAIRRRRKR